MNKLVIQVWLALKFAPWKTFAIAILVLVCCRPPRLCIFSQKSAGCSSFWFVWARQTCLCRHCCLLYVVPNYLVIKNWVELISFTYMVKLKATVLCRSPTFPNFIAPSSHCRSWSLCEALVSKNIVFFQSHHPCCDKSSKWHDGPFHQTNCLCPFGALEIFFSSCPTSANTFLLHSHLQIPSSILLAVSAFPVQLCSLPSFPSAVFLARPPVFSLPARSTLFPSFSTYLCVCACGTRALVVIFQAAAQKIGLS